MPCPSANQRCFSLRCFTPRWHRWDKRYNYSIAELKLSRCWVGWLFMKPSLKCTVFKLLKKILSRISLAFRIPLTSWSGQKRLGDERMTTKKRSPAVSTARVPRRQKTRYRNMKNQLELVWLLWGRGMKSLKRMDVLCWRGG